MSEFCSNASKLSMMGILEKASKIKLLVCDVDGVFTSGQLFFSYQGNQKEFICEEYIKIFHVQDGLGIKLLRACGIEIAVISGRQSELVEKRIHELGIQYLYQGCEDKLPVFHAMVNALNLSYEQVAYMGDDLPDIAPIRLAGLGIAVSNANPLVKQYADWQTTLPGGAGAVREACDLVLQAQDRIQWVLEQYV